MKKSFALFASIILLSCQQEISPLPSFKSSAIKAIGISDSSILQGGSYTTPCNADIASTITGWNLVFSDEFAGTAVDQTKWKIWTGGAFNNELQYYQGANISISGGIMSIQAKAQKVRGVATPFTTSLKSFNYTSGRLESNILFSAAASSVTGATAAPKIRMAARIKLPAGYGMWPAFWSYGDPWPTEGEIDILEAKGQKPNTYYTNYFYGTQTNTNLVQNATSTMTSSSSLQTCYHIYEVIWEQSKLSFYLDGILVDTKSGGYVPNLFGKKEKVVLNLAVGGNFFQTLNTTKIVPGTLLVDWVRIYTAP
ncbi:MAG: glycoside hydrolase family 16 protein [Bacteroidetes bacterium]|nr:glycoside hydrolase family 16 protein [Bacteroidota bacterium]